MPSFGFEKQYKSQKNIPSTPPPSSFEGDKELQLEFGEGDEQIIKLLRSRVEEYKALMNFNVETQGDDKFLSANETLLPEQQKLIAEIVTLLGTLGKELKNQSVLISSLKDGNIEPLDTLLPSYAKLFPEKHPSPRDTNESGAPTEL